VNSMKLEAAMNALRLWMMQHQLQASRYRVTIGADDPLDLARVEIAASADVSASTGQDVAVPRAMEIAGRMSHFYEIHGRDISRACADVRPGELFRIRLLEQLPFIADDTAALMVDIPTNLITFQRAFDGEGFFVVEGHKLIDDFNQRHRAQPPAGWSLSDQIKTATEEMEQVMGHASLRR